MTLGNCGPAAILSEHEAWVEIDRIFRSEAIEHGAQTFELDEPFAPDPLRPFALKLLQAYQPDVYEFPKTKAQFRDSIELWRRGYLHRVLDTTPFEGKEQHSYRRTAAGTQLAEAHSSSDSK
jgi:hypothetical protein